LIKKSFNPDYFLESFSCYRPDFNENSRKTPPVHSFLFQAGDPSDLNPMKTTALAAG